MTANRTASPKRALGRVETCARRRTIAEDEYRAAILAARAAGATFSQIGRAAGISKQRAQQIASEG